MFGVATCASASGKRAENVKSFLLAFAALLSLAGQSYSKICCEPEPLLMSTQNQIVFLFFWGKLRKSSKSSKSATVRSGECLRCSVKSRIDGLLPSVRRTGLGLLLCSAADSEDIDSTGISPSHQPKVRIKKMGFELAFDILDLQGPC